MSAIAEPAATSSASVWTDSERAAWRPLEDITPWAWAEKYRYLTPRQSARPGPWRNSEGPYLIPFFVLATKPGVEEITVLKASQCKWSEGTRCLIGFWAHREPDPILLVLPDKDLGKAIIEERMIPLFEDTAVLRELATGRARDQKSLRIVLSTGLVVRVGFSGSIASVASHPARRVLNDERSKFQDDGKVSIADSIQRRTATYENSLVVNLSTPGPDPDPTEALFENSNVKLFFHVSCPHCGRWQQLATQRLKWWPNKEDEPDKVKRAEAVVKNRSAWIECENPDCAKLYPNGQGRITEDHRRGLIPRGYFGTLDGSYKVFCDGHEEGSIGLSEGIRVGFFAPAFLSLAPKHRLYRIAERLILAAGDALKLRGVHNEDLAEVFREKIGADTSPNDFARRCRPKDGFTPGPARKVPAWASKLLLTVDTQKDSFYCVVRAWGQGMRNRRVHHCLAHSFEELAELFYRTAWSYEGDKFPAIGCSLMAIDTGGTKEEGEDASRTQQVYRFCRLDPFRLIPIKGASNPRREISTTVVDCPPPGAGQSPFKLKLWYIDVGHFNDLLESAIHERVPIVDHATGEQLGEADQWELNDVDDPVYNAHMAAVHKVRVKVRGTWRERWRPKTQGARHDYRDCEKLQMFLAHGPARCFALPTPEQIAAERKAAVTANKPSGGLRTPDGRAFLANRRK